MNLGGAGSGVVVWGVVLGNEIVGVVFIEGFGCGDNCDDIAGFVVTG